MIPVAPIVASPAGLGGATTPETTGLDFKADNAVLPPLEDVAPVRILTAPLTSERLQNLPSQAEPEAAQDEPLLRDSEDAPNRSSDEETPSPFTTLNGLEEESALPQTLIVTLASSRFGATNSVEEEIFRPNPEVSASIRRRNPRILIGALCAAAAVIVIAAIIVVFHYRRPDSVHIAVQTASSTVAPPPSAARTSQGQPSQSQASQGQPSNPASNAVAPAQPAPVKPVPQSQKGSDKESSPQGRPSSSETAKSHPAPQKAESGNCGLDSNILPKMLDQAERNREQGNYSAAARQYRSVLDCDRNNARARSGLELTLIDIRHQ